MSQGQGQASARFAQVAKVARGRGSFDQLDSQLCGHRKNKISRQTQAGQQRSGGVSGRPSSPDRAARYAPVSPPRHFILYLTLHAPSLRQSLDRFRRKAKDAV